MIKKSINKSKFEVKEWGIVNPLPQKSQVKKNIKLPAVPPIVKKKK